MFVKTRVNKNGIQLYAMCALNDKGVKTYSKEGPLSKMEPIPSQRKAKRHPDNSPKNNNRKATKCRIVQHIDGTAVHLIERKMETIQMGRRSVEIERLYAVKSRNKKAHVIHRIPESIMIARKTMILKRYKIAL